MWEWRVRVGMGVEGESVCVGGGWEWVWGGEKGTAKSCEMFPGKLSFSAYNPTSRP